MGGPFGFRLIEDGGWGLGFRVYCLVCALASGSSVNFWIGEQLFGLSDLGLRVYCLGPLK